MLIKESWEIALIKELKAPYMKELRLFLKGRYSETTVYPKKENIYDALNHFDLKNTKVVIIGQDPYHGYNQANGLAFSVSNGVDLPPSLRNIFKEIESDTGIRNSSGDLTKWAKQGILLLNTTLTVEKGLPLSHQNRGWEKFTDKIIETVNDNLTDVIFLLWGGKAKLKARLINETKHKILTAPHPSPLSVYRGFYGCKHFSKINEILINNNKKPIDWRT